LKALAMAMYRLVTAISDLSTSHLDSIPRRRAPRAPPAGPPGYWHVRS
jgi:hypothetical protein